MSDLGTCKHKDCDADTVGVVTIRLPDPDIHTVIAEDQREQDVGFCQVHLDMVKAAVYPRRTDA